MKQPVKGTASKAVKAKAMVAGKKAEKSSMQNAPKTLFSGSNAGLKSDKSKAQVASNIAKSNVMKVAPKKKK